MLEDVFGLSCFNCCVGAVQFCPCFFQNAHPEFFLAAGKSWFSIPKRQEIIHNHYFWLSVQKNAYCIYPRFIYPFRDKNLIYSAWLPHQTAYRRHEIAVSKCSLLNNSVIGVFVEKLRVYLSGPSPFHFVEIVHFT